MTIKKCDYGTNKIEHGHTRPVVLMEAGAGHHTGKTKLCSQDRCAYYKGGA